MLPNAISSLVALLALVIVQKISMRWLENLLNWSRPSELQKRVVCFKDDGFEVTLGNDRQTRVVWNSVVEITAFKHDLFSVDEICLGFRCRGDDRFYWAGEEDVGFDALRAEVERRFADIRPQWFLEIAVPAFHEKWTTIWKSDGCD